MVLIWGLEWGKRGEGVEGVIKGGKSRLRRELIRKVTGGWRTGEGSSVRERIFRMWGRDSENFGACWG